jgi:flagellin-like hook-associated protein FlgL
MARLNVLQQAGAAILANSNFQPQLALKLLNDT